MLYIKYIKLIDNSEEMLFYFPSLSCFLFSCLLSILPDPKVSVVTFLFLRAVVIVKDTC